MPPGSDRPQIRDAHLERWVDRARQRLGIDAALAATCRTGLWLFPLLALARFGLLRLESSLGDPLWMSAFAALGLSVAFAVAYAKRPSRLASAVHLDGCLQAGGAIAATFELGSEDPVGYLKLVSERAQQRLNSAPLPEVLPLHRPGALGPLVLVLLAFGAALAVRPYAPSVAVPLALPTGTKTEHARLLLGSEELALLAQRAERLLAGATSERGRQRALEYAELVERLQKGTLDQRQALSAAAALERDILDERGAGDPISDDHEPASGDSEKGKRPSAEGAEDPRREDAAEALQRLAERLAQETTPPSKRELERIRESLQKTREEAHREHQKEQALASQQADRLRDKERRLLQKKKEKGELDQNEAAELERTQRQLERLDRQKKQAEQAASDLDRQLAEAMRELAENPKKAGEFLDQAAAGRTQEQSRQLTDDEKRELLDQLRALKERLRQGEQSDLTEQLREFERRARGQRPSAGEGQEGQPGQTQPRVSLAPRGSSGAGQPSPTGGPPGQGEPTELGTGTSPEPGTEHDPNWQGEASPGLGAKTEDKAAAARDTGDGASESETILTAAEEGFRAAAYERLYKDYQTVLEEMVKGETIPRERRTEVERYFDLIRPRSD